MLDLVLAAAFHSSVPFSLVDNRIVVSARINGKSGYAMIVDTGASGVLITPSAARSLHIRGSQAAPVSGAGPGSSVARRATLQSVRLGSYGVGPTTALIVDLTRIQRAFHFPHLDGVIGYDELGGRYVAIDMERHRLTVSSSPVPAAIGARTAPYAVDGGFLTIEAAIDGVHGRAILDSGDRWAFTAFRPFARANNFYNVSLRRASVMTGIGVGGTIRGDVLFSTVDALGFTAQAVPTRAPVGPSGGFDSAAAIGSVGEGLLKRYDLIFDGRARTITAWPAASVTASFDPPPIASAARAVLARHGTFGAALIGTSGGARIARIVAGGSAAAAGLQQGDSITRFGGVPIESATAFLAAVHRAHAGQRVAVTFVRSKRVQTVVVTLGRPLDERDPSLQTSYGAIAVDGTLRRTLVTMPQHARGRLPAMLIAGGIGCYSVDMAADPQDAYRHLAFDVSNAGFVTMRVEKSGVGDSEGPPCTRVDFAAEQRAYAAALAALRANPNVDPGRIYLFGHSIGSLHAPMLANASPVAGVIVAEAVGRDWPEYEIRNTRRQLELGGGSVVSVDSAVAEKVACLSRLLLEAEPEEQIERTMPSCKVHNGVYPVDAPYMRQVAALKIIEQWTKVSVPVLAVFGTADIVTEKADHQRIVEAVNAQHAGLASYAEISGMDHFLDTAATPGTYDPAFSRIVVDWLLARDKKPASTVGHNGSAAPERLAIAAPSLYVAKYERLSQSAEINLSRPSVRSIVTSIL